MKILSISLTEKTMMILDELMEKEGYPSRSEIIRVAIRDFLKNTESFEEWKETIARERKEIEDRRYKSRNKKETGKKFIFEGKEYLVKV